MSMNLRIHPPAVALLVEACAGIPDNVSIKRLAEHGCVVSQQTFNRWKRGLVRPDEDKWEAIKLAFGIAPHLWLTDAARSVVVASAVEASR